MVIDPRFTRDQRRNPEGKEHQPPLLQLLLLHSLFYSFFVLVRGPQELQIKSILANISCSYFILLCILFQFLNISYILSEKNKSFPRYYLMKRAHHHHHHHHQIFLDGHYEIIYTTSRSYRAMYSKEKRTQRPVQKTSSILFAGLHERAILPEATGRCKRLD